MTEEATAMTEAYELRVEGIVQGVGFRPFVYRQALRWGLAGWVLNTGDGVHVHIEGTLAALEGFVEELPRRAPTAAHITTLKVSADAVEGLHDFSIRVSDAEATTSTLISPDMATCPACLRELFDPEDRRFHYPFINCTNCGPRFTIIDALPYDRHHTSMAPFEMCEACDAEYHDPLDRRFHAQPDACFDCGPVLRLWRDGQEALRAEGQAESDMLIEQAASLIAQGGIVALKGLGGYHLACDATNEEAVARLRTRKHRRDKPFALMVRDLAQARSLCEVNAVEATLLDGIVRPIVLLERRAPCHERAVDVGGTGAGATEVGGTGAGGDLSTGSTGSTGDGFLSTYGTGTIARSVAGNLHELGIMLPSTPLQHLLIAALTTPLVMTSGNLSEEPIIAQEAEAHRLLGGVADAFLDNDREIRSRYDDSVVRVIGRRIHLIRRARGFAPQPLRMPPLPQAFQKQHAAAKPQPGILAVGPEQKSTFCLVRGTDAFVSQHLGDLESASAFEAWLATLNLYQRLFDLRYHLIACDTHPEYLSTKWARAQDEARIEVQHHHAHIASVLAEHRARRAGTDSADGVMDGKLIERVIGIAFDGTGFGQDGTLWGGEALIATLEDFERFAHLRPVPVPGGRAAIEHPDRMAWAYLHELGLTQHPGAALLTAQLGADRLLLLEQMMAANINSPKTSSIGRLFDAVSALLGICATGSYEGQAAVELEAALYDPRTAAPVLDANRAAAAERYRFAMTDNAAQEPNEADEDAGTDAAESRSGDERTPALVFDPTPLLSALLDDYAARVATSLIALRFHEAIIRLIAELCERARRRWGLSTVALGGGVFMNRYLLTHTVPLLESEGFTVLLNRDLPANDGAISYGQAVVAAARLAYLTEEGIL
jgi:hydrogenase maturation protein HypF